MWQEKRTDKRINLSLPIDYESLETTKREHDSTVSKDISEGGMRIVLKKFYPPKTKFLLKINLEGINKIIEAMAEIAWSFNAQFSNAYYSGLRFSEIDVSDRRILREYIKIKEITRAA
ncbi:MAG: PilZ domain-containing protein [Candidatus Omnitrophica bacterium]|nr:PilZ domain-containing protein [Candidatus Omnitrophota bacterium]